MQFIFELWCEKDENKQKEALVSTKFDGNFTTETVEKCNNKTTAATNPLN